MNNGITVCFKRNSQYNDSCVFLTDLTFEFDTLRNLHLCQRLMSKRVYEYGYKSHKTTNTKTVLFYFTFLATTAGIF